MKRMTQTETVFNHLTTHKGITSMEAFELYGVTRLSAIIFSLRYRGYDIINVPHETTNRYGGKVTYVEYRLRGELKE